MEHDDLKTAWQSLERRLARQERIQLDLLRDDRLRQARRGLRPLLVGQWLQLALGVALAWLGAACWTRQFDAPGFLAAGLAVHGFGVLTLIGAATTLSLAAAIDYDAPVVRIQKRLAQLLRAQTLNMVVCGTPWWIAWVLVVVAIAGLRASGANAPTAAWVWASLAIGAIGLIATWAWIWRSATRIAGPASEGVRERCGDGMHAIRRSRQLVAEVKRFEQD
ncbi:hypothetical protein [Luteimonas sp. FCS-9]|uniref:hypothetical protein n=1 Tax=Luteimonas sp. FCS-9 TaxID=1547516 RepID=UPI00069AF88C|nr:hypothetical protein [Luteimonas sp. FCS-9]